MTVVDCSSERVLEQGALDDALVVDMLKEAVESSLAVVAGCRGLGMLVMDVYRQGAGSHRLAAAVTWTILGGLRNLAGL